MTHKIDNILQDESIPFTPRGVGMAILSVIAFVIIILTGIKIGQMATARIHGAAASVLPAVASNVPASIASIYGGNQ